MKKIALITGITGQDGSYLAELLLKKNYEVHGLIRRSSIIKTDRINHLFNNKSIFNKKFFLHYGDMTDDLSIFNIISNIRPNEIYNLAAQSHVKVSFELPLYTSNADALGILRILEAVKSLNNKSKVYQASTSELFGQTSNLKTITEKTPFNPVSPYAVAKLYAHEIVKTYRMAYGIFACNGILFNHESPRRGETFVTRKITMGLSNYVKNGKSFELGNLDTYRDWGHARDYVEGMWKMLQLKNPEDFILATNKSISIREFLKKCFKYLGIKPVYIKNKTTEEIRDKSNNKLILKTNSRLLRPNEVPFLRGSYDKAKKVLNWEPKTSLEQLIKEMIDTDLNK